MRIVSLVPAATEIAIALGAAPELIAVTHDDDHPAVERLARVTSSTIPHGATAREIDTLVREAGARGESTFHLDPDAFIRARPDVVLGQTLCAVCAITLDQLPERLPHAPAVVALTADSLEGMLADIVRVGDAIGRSADAATLVARLCERLGATADSVRALPRPRVACVEWIDPLFNAGHWVPEQVAIAGGHDVLGAPGERSREITFDELQRASADIIVAMPCGWDARRAAEEARSIATFKGPRVFAVDGAAYFSRPGPRLVDGAELLASICHPDRCAAPGGALAIEVEVAASV